jgi:hypothetical protein
MSVRLKMTEPMRSALDAVCAHVTNAKAVGNLIQYAKPECVDLPFSAAESISELFRKLPAERRALLVPICGAGYVHELLQGTGLYVEPMKLRTRPPQLERHLKRVAARVEQAEHDGRVNKLKDSTISFAADFESLNFVSFGVNMLALMITGFIVFWYHSARAPPINSLILRPNL